MDGRMTYELKFLQDEWHILIDGKTVFQCDFWPDAMLEYAKICAQAGSEEAKRALDMH
jgi:hypothetical protein